MVVRSIKMPGTRTEAVNKQNNRHVAGTGQPPSSYRSKPRSYLGRDVQYLPGIQLAGNRRTDVRTVAFPFARQIC